MTDEQTHGPPGPLGHVTWSLDLAVAGLLVVLTVLAPLLYGYPPQIAGHGDHALDAALIGTFLCAVTVLRRRRPLVTLGLATAGCLAHLALLPMPTPSVLAVLLVAYSVARWVSGRRARIVLGLALAGAIAGPLRWSDYLAGYSATDGFPTAMFLLAASGCGGLAITCYAIGRRVRESAQADLARARAEAERRHLALAEHEQRTRSTEAAVRTQIARELHDIVAHSLSVMIVQAEGGRALATKRPERAPEVLDTIAETGREALGEMRRIVGVLRGSPGDLADYAPTPGLVDIPEMVARTDPRVHLYIDGEPPHVPSTLGLTVFRVVQEAITNFLKHAGSGASAQVTLTYTPTLVIAEISDDGVGSTASSSATGHGLQGLRERVTSMNGQLLAQPKPTGGFLVRAILPVPLRTSEREQYAVPGDRRPPQDTPRTHQGQDFR
ncbi:histidine kinase [Luteococcus sp. Sow4_B9]|uniref:sensor histidine kinase n=1 Tax=Luteococcus sp. Sow4_B9 TaxID=3438792 RepID=UPI003F981200